MSSRISGVGILKSDIIVRREERGFAATAHLVNMIPLWGYLFLIMLYFYFREKSREVTFHVKQAMSFTFIFHMVLMFYLFAEVMFRLISILNSELALILQSLNWGIFIGAFGIHCIICLYGIIMVYKGSAFYYPIVGRKVFKSHQRLWVEERS